MPSDDLLNDLTVVIPAYRCAKFLPATVASALRPPGTHILIAENGGGDDTLAVAQKLAEKWPDRIRVTANEKNIGMTPNWQKAVSSVQTTYTHYLSADDIISTPYLIAAVKFLRAHPRVAMVAGGQYDVPENFVLDGSVPNDEPVSESDFKTMQGVEIARFALQWEPFAAGSSTVYRTDVWREIGGYDVKLGWCSDRELWFRMGRHHDVAFTPKMAVHYRVLDSSVSADNRRGDLFCYELSHMLRRAQKDWPEAELRPLFRKNFKLTARVFVGSSVRAARRGRWQEVLPRFGRGVADLSKLI